MNKFRQRVSAPLLFFLFSLSTPSIGEVQVHDKDIRILAVASPGTSTVGVLEQLDFLTAKWPGSNGVTVSLANGGVPIPLSQVLTGGGLAQLNQAVSDPAWDALRTTWGADLMIVFSPSISGQGACGRAVQINWTSIDDPIPGNFIANPLTMDLDLRGAVDSYYAISEVSAGCPTLTAAHEMAHLLGSGHTKSVAAGKYLTSTSHAAVSLATRRGVTMGNKTIAAQGANPPECVAEQVECGYIFVYSNGVALGGDDGDTEGTFEITALSVANYINGAGGSNGGGGGGGALPECNDGIDNDGDGFVDYGSDPDCASFSDDDEDDTSGGGGGCSLQSPSSLTAVFVGACAPYPTTQYSLFWTDTCPSATSYYEVYKEQPIGSGFVFGWQSFVPSSPVFINGPPGKLRVRSCSLSSCSGYSNTITITDSC